jgi:serine/threonine protein phosphatase PrpC
MNASLHSSGSNRNNGHDAKAGSAMKHHKPLRMLAGVGILSLAAVAVLRIGEVKAGHVAAASPALGTFWHAIQRDAEHVTSTQLMVAAAVAWVVFVLSLVLLARSKPGELDRKKTHRERLPAETVTQPAPRQQPQAPESQTFPHVWTPTLPASSAEVSEQANTQPSATDTPLTRPIASLVEAVPPRGAEVPKTEDEWQPDPVDWRPVGAGVTTPAQSSQGHTVALTGVMEARERLLGVGLFVVAEDTQASRSDGAASRLAVDVIARQMAPVLTGSLPLDNAQRASLLQLAVLHARVNACEERVRVVTEQRDVAITAALVIDNAAQIVTAGNCRTYVFQSSGGLTELVREQTTASRFTEDRPHNEGAPHVGRPHDLPCGDLGLGQFSSEVNSFEVYTEPGDLVLLTSPGLWQALHQPQVEAILHAAPDAHSAARVLAREAARQPEVQSFGVIVVRPREGCTPGFGVAMSRAGLH